MKIEKLYQNKEWLIKKYWDERLSLIRIGRIYKIPHSKIWRWMKKFNIPRRHYSIPDNVKYKDKEWLYNKYQNENLSTYQIGKLCGMSGQVICKWLLKYNIPRQYLEHINRNHCDLSQEAIEWINGELLGDMSLQSRSTHSAQFGYSSKYLEYINYISNTLESFGIKRTGRITKRIDKKYNSQSWSYQSLCYPGLLLIRKKWYPDNKKIVPKDIRLTPITLRQHYIGDGCLLYPKRGKPYIILSTNNYSISDIEWLRVQLINLGIRTTRQKAIKGNTIYVSPYSTKDFLKYIGDCPVECYKYKWNYDKERKV